MSHAQAEAIAPHVFCDWERFQQAAHRIATSESVCDVDGVNLYLEAFLQQRYCKKLWMEVFQAAASWGLIPSMN